MIRTDRAPGHPATIAEPESDYEMTKRVDELVPHDVLAVDFAAWGVQYMAVDWVEPIPDGYRVALSTPTGEFASRDFTDGPNQRVVIYPPFRVGTWR